MRWPAFFSSTCITFLNMGSGRWPLGWPGHAGSRPSQTRLSFEMQELFGRWSSAVDILAHSIGVLVQLQRLCMDICQLLWAQLLVFNQLQYFLRVISPSPADSDLAYTACVVFELEGTHFRQISLGVH